MTNIKNFDYIIVGSGIAGVTAAQTIREFSPDSSILLANNEDRLPYKRTKINKNITTGFVTNEFALHPAEWYAHNNITLAATAVTYIDTHTKKITTQDGVYGYGKLLLTTGSLPRSTGNKQWDAMMLHIRTAAQAQEIIDRLKDADRFLVIGGGSEGVETAVQLSKAGKSVTLMDKNSYLLRNYITKEMADRILHTLTQNGIKVLLNQRIEEIRQSNGYSVSTSTNTIDAECIICCLGASPNIGLAVAAGIRTGKGIMVDSFMQTSADAVYAAGDVAEHSDGNTTGLWHSAEYQGMVAALNMTGRPTPFNNKPFRFKTEIFDCYCFSAGFKHFATPTNIEKSITESTIRMIAHADDKIKGIVSLNEKDMAQLFQQAVMEEWGIEQLNKTIEERKKFNI